MFEQLEEYIKNNPKQILWILIALVIIVIYLYMMSKKDKKRSKKKSNTKDLEAGELPKPESTNSDVDNELLDEINKI